MTRLILFFVLVFISGLSGLLYEVVWQRYLAILLGAQAWATALVLAVYLGGLSAGYFFFGSLTRRYRANWLLAYSAIEMALAFWAFAFPTLFSWALQWGAIPDFVASTLLLALPTFLMGGTLPLLTQGLSTDLNEASHTHARLYGFNTLGACFGCLLTGYWLIPHFGLAWTTQFGAALNLIVSMGAALMAWGVKPSEASPVRAVTMPLTREEKTLLGIGFLSGFYLIALQTVLIRLMGLSIGASNFSFALVVSVFVFSLSVGSLAAKRISTYRVDHLFWNQLAAAIVLFFLYLSVDSWSYGAHVVRALLRDVPEAFVVYHFALGTLLLLLLFIPLGLSGLTLPLCFHLLKNNKEGLGARVGLLYGINTLGCIAGALLGGYALLYVLDLDQIFKLCVFCVLATVAGAAYVGRVWRGWGRRQSLVASSLVSFVLVGTLFAPLFHKERFLQAFRYPQPIAATFEGPGAFSAFLARTTQLLFWKDGPNTSLGIGGSFYQGKEMSRTVFVNGKSDGNTRGDFLTTNLIAHLPALFSPSPERTCVIGYGTGMTVGTLLHYPQVKSIDVVEIAGTILENASYFDPYNGLASKSPKVHFHEMDAMRFLGGRHAPFDIIISEPSNPWVSGVENLFALEFYERAKASLSPTGLFVQWIHTYSFTDALFKLVIGTMGRSFPYVSVFQLKGGDFALVGSAYPLGRAESERGKQRFDSLSAVRLDLGHVGFTAFEPLLGLEVLGPATVAQIAASTPQPHTLLKPLLSDAAARAFFVGAAVDVDAFRRFYRSYFQSFTSSLLRQHLGNKAVTPQQALEFQRAYCLDSGVKVDFLCREALQLSQFESGLSIPSTPAWIKDPSRALASLSLFQKSSSPSYGEKELDVAYHRFEAFKAYASPVFYLGRNRLLGSVEDCLAKTPARSEIWGQCQLQKVLVLEWIAQSSEELGKAKDTYLQWFETLSPQSPRYQQLREARDLLKKM